MKNTPFYILFVATLFFPFSSISVEAQENVLNPLCTRTGNTGAVCEENSRTLNEDESSGNVLDVASTVLDIFSYVIGVAAVVVLFISGVKFATSAGDPAKISNARNTIIYALIGIVVAVLAQSIVLFVLDRL
ncbi:hypothetical protein BH23PAT2_BH23PAT2_06020 [soil metagenome]